MLWEVCLLAIPVACCSWTIAETEVFRSVREWLAKWAGWKKGTDANTLKAKIAYLVTCYYCSSHYVTAAFMALYPIKLLSSDFRGYVIGGFAVVGISAVYLTTFNGLRVALRWGQAVADRAGIVAKESKDKMRVA